MKDLGNLYLNAPLNCYYIQYPSTKISSPTALAFHTRPNTLIFSSNVLKLYFFLDVAIPIQIVEHVFWLRNYEQPKLFSMVYTS